MESLATTQAGLSADERGILLSFDEVLDRDLGQKPVYCCSLREKYADDPYTLEEIDFNDPSSEYRQQMLAYADAFSRSDLQAAEQLEDWFATNYPLHQGGL